MVDKLVEEMARAIHDAMDVTDGLDLAAAETYAQACAAITQKRVNELEAALKPFARVAAIADHLPSRVPDETPCREFFPGIWPTLGDCRKARAALPTMLKGNGDG